MSKTGHNPFLKPKRFAALLAGFDIGNPSEAEAMNCARAWRRMAVDCDERIVDLLELPDVRKAIDDQLQPKRIVAQEVMELRNELTLRMDQVTRLARLLKCQEDRTEALRKELSDLKSKSGSAAQAGPSTSQGSNSHSFGEQSWVIQIAGVVITFVLICLALFLNKK
jgi:hypothetical protein